MVNLGADTTAELVGLRAQAESRMTETVQFYTSKETDGGPPNYDPVTVKTVIGETKARVRFQRRIGIDTETAGQMIAVRSLEVHVPVGSIDVGPSVTVEVLASTIDPGLVGRKYRTVAAPEMGTVTAWRYSVEEHS